MKNEQIEKIVYFVRHGQSEGNISPVFQSHESPLTEVGKHQADRIAGRINKLTFETLISSPLPRTKETAEAIAKMTGKKPEYSELFVERIKPSGIGGKSYEDERASKLWRDWEISLYTSEVKVEDGENFDEIIERADKALDFLKKRTEKHLVVVTHGFFLRTIIARVLLNDSLTAANFKNFQSRATMENTGLSAIKFSKGYEDSHWRLWMYNDHAHLG
jgi:broad specificity phosphatase PhoE